MNRNEQKQYKIVQKWTKRKEIIQKCTKMNKNEHNWLKMKGNNTKMNKNEQKWTKMIKNERKQYKNEQKWTKMNRNDSRVHFRDVGALAIRILETWGAQMGICLHLCFWGQETSACPPLHKWAYVCRCVLRRGQTFARAVQWAKMNGNNTKMYKYERE